MIKFFRRIRQRLLSENRFSKYLIYAIGEIILVMIGILLALQVNNWNERRKADDKATALRAKLIKELETDLLLIEGQKKTRERSKQNILNYVDYLNQEAIHIDTLLKRKKQAEYIINGFTKTSFTLDELTTTGTINLFTDEEKQAIIELKATQELFGFYERESMNEVADDWKRTKQAIDGLFDNGLTKKQHHSVKDWQYNINSEQYRIYHNELNSVLELLEYQDKVVHPTITKYTTALIEELRNHQH